MYVYVFIDIYKAKAIIFIKAILINHELFNYLVVLQVSLTKKSSLYFEY